MPAELYETLGIASNATSEEIRKAYKKRALETHPDRLPPNATPSEKAASEEKFRKVNNAYEVLNDAQNRRLYDRFGVWPPPEPEHHPRPSHRHHHHFTTRRHTYHDDPFSDPFFNRAFTFTDPFELFDSIFRDMHHSHSSSRRRRTTGWDDQFDDYRPPHPVNELNSFMNSMHRNMFGNMGPSPFSAFPAISMGMPQGNGHGRNRWTSESTMSQTINGVTHTIHKRRDWDGNEHVTRVFPDGRRVLTINGVEQPDQGRLSAGQDPRHVPPPPVMDYANNHDHYLPAPPPYSTAPQPGAGAYRSAPPMEPNYSDHHSFRSHRSHRSSRHHAEPHPSMPGDRYNTVPGVTEGNMYNSGAIPEPVDHRSHHKKHWWNRH